MALSSLRILKQCAVLQEQKMLESVPSHTRGIYVLFKHQPKTDNYDVVYVGLAGGPHAGIRRRLRSHSREKRGAWTHFSVYEVHDNVQPDDVSELESLFRQIYSKDSRANRLNIQKGSKKLKDITRNLPW